MCRSNYRNVSYLNDFFLTLFTLQLTKTEDSNVYATDAILSTIMCCTRSSNSWDVVVQKIAGKLFFDKRDDSEFGKFGFQVIDKFWYSSLK